MNYACMLYAFALIPLKAISEKGLGHSSLQGIATPFPAGTIDCVWDDSFHPQLGELCAMGSPQKVQQLPMIFCSPW